jgi:ApbE superfamily uncharacterized protein (UPF0280 family)
VLEGVVRRRISLNNRRTRVAASPAAARSTASIAGSIARLLVTAMLQQQEPLLYTVDSQ